MPSLLPHPVLQEAQTLAAETREVRQAVIADGLQFGDGQMMKRLRQVLARDTQPPQSGAVLERMVQSFPSPLQAGLRDFVSLTHREHELKEDAEQFKIIAAGADQRFRALSIAASALRDDKHRERRRNDARKIVSQAVASNRDLTLSERVRVAVLRSTPADSERTAWQATVTDATTRDEVLSVLGSIRLRKARSQLLSGLLLTTQMLGIIDEALPALHRGDPVLLVGETGGAKTALAEYLSRVGIGREPESVSGYGDITSAQLIGVHELRASSGATTSVFVPGPLLRAMSDGRPLILDEVNAMPPEFLKRLNRILQLRPGDVLHVQENAGRPVTIAPGFVILATANEQTPHRYRGLDRLSAELVNRFGANSYRVHYPDAGLSYSDLPVENALLAAASIVDRQGQLPHAITVDQLHAVSRTAFISQQVFAGRNGEGFESFVSTEREIDGRPGLEESVLAPRTLVAILQKVAGSAGEVTLEQALGRFVEGIMHREDRRVLALILEGQGFQVS